MTLTKLTNLFRKPSSEAIAARELDEAKRQLLSHQTAEEFHGHMVDYYEQKIVRLQRYLCKT